MVSFRGSVAARRVRTGPRPSRVTRALETTVLRLSSLVLLAVWISIHCPDVCANEAGQAPEGAAKSDEAILLERAKAYWVARYAQDMQRAYAFEDPVRRRRLSVIDYIRMVGDPGRMYGIEVKGVKVQGDQADVEVEMLFRHTIPPWDKRIVRTTHVDDWQKIDDVWYHVVDLHSIRTGKPRVDVEKGTIEYPPQEGVVAK